MPCHPSLLTNNTHKANIQSEAKKSRRTHQARLPSLGLRGGRVYTAQSIHLHGLAKWPTSLPPYGNNTIFSYKAWRTNLLEDTTPLPRLSSSRMYLHAPPAFTHQATLGAKHGKEAEATKKPSVRPNTKHSCWKIISSRAPPTPPPSSDRYNLTKTREAATSAIILFSAA